jgi:hypothetical protein
LNELTLDYKLESHALHPTLAALTKQGKELDVRMADLSTRLDEVRKKEFSGGGEGMRKKGDNMQSALMEMGRQQRQLNARMYAIQQEMLRDVVSKADVVRSNFLHFHWILTFDSRTLTQKIFPQICTTCITSACVALNVTDFPVVFLDEASMSTEPASLIPIMKGVIGHLLLPNSTGLRWLTQPAVRARSPHW